MTGTDEKGVAEVRKLVGLPPGARQEGRTRRGGHVTPTGHGDWARAWRILALPLAITSLGVTAGIIISAATGPEWQVQSTIAFSPSSQDPILFPSSNASVADRELADAAALATSEAVLSPASSRLDAGANWTDLQDAITVMPSTGSDIITITGTATSKNEAVARVDAVVASFIQVSRQRVIEAANRTADAANNGDASAYHGQTLSDIAARARVLARTADPVRVLSTTPATQTGPALLRDGATGGVLGLLFVATALVLASGRPMRVSTSQDAAEIFGLPSGAIRNGQVVPSSRALVSDLQRLSGNLQTPRIVVVPAGAGSTRAAVEVATALRSAAPGKRTTDAPDTTRLSSFDERETAVGESVIVTGDPLTTVIAPLLREASAVVLAVDSRASVRDVRAVRRLTEQWERPPDAAIVTG